MPHPYWPLFDLEVRTPRLVLRLPNDDDLIEVVRLVLAGIHPVGAMPFETPWTIAPSPELERNTLQFHWRQRAEWSPTAWHLALVVWCDGELVGSQSVEAKDFAVTGVVETGSWLGLAHQGKGIGKEMRAAVLHLAFAGLGAREAHSAAFDDNPSSIRVSRAVGYEDNGEDVWVRQGQPARLLRFRMTRERWEATRTLDVDVRNLPACRELFGVSSEA